MAAPKGHPKWGGRKKGTPNKVKSGLSEKLEASGKDPFQTLMDLLDHSEAGIRLSAAKELAQYLEPKRKAIEMKMDGEVQHELSEDIKALFQTWIKLAKGERG